MIPRPPLVLLLCWLLCLSAAFAFTPTRIRHRTSTPSPTTTTCTSLQRTTNQPWTRPVCRSDRCRNTHLYNNRKDGMNVDDSAASPCWNPRVRTVMGLLATAGFAETSFLTYEKLFGNSVAIQELCGLEGDCGSVLTGPYSILPGPLHIPLALLGMVAYATVAYLATRPLVVRPQSQDEEDTNRVLLAATSTGMGVFSVFLLMLLFGVLHQNCTFCVASAVISILLAKLAWISSLVPKQHTKTAIQSSLGTSVTALVAAATIFGANASPSDASSSVKFADTVLGGGSGDSTSILVGDAKTKQKEEGLSPPPITRASSTQAIQLATKLQQLDGRLFGAYWCSHCYDQKETLGAQAMIKIPYVECSKEGYQQQSKLCRERDIPGYPTWEIAGKLYPGEQSLEELEEIVTKAQALQQ